MSFAPITACAKCGLNKAHASNLIWKSTPGAEGWYITESGGPTYVKCSCGSRGPMAMNEQDAIKLWNIEQKELELWYREWNHDS